ncbi:MAG: methyltransferase domain-containing protein [Pseudomonadota bacterium]|nr:MAG: methyltransferase domain-containing protein [Pseudomonadota bacterium]
MQSSELASIDFALSWQGTQARHRDRCHFDKVDFWRDLMPGALGERLAALDIGEIVTEQFASGELVPAFREHELRSVNRSQIRGRNGMPIEPHAGRFYPRGLLSGVDGIYPQDTHPFRCLGAGDDSLHVDLNHPLSRNALSVEACVIEQLSRREERGGRCNDIAADMTENGPGLQDSLRDVETDFFSGKPFAREDERGDHDFYAQPRMVDHIDAVARSHISAIYGNLLSPGMQVLDLMSSCNSHLPRQGTNQHVTGLGMNNEELRNNPALAERLVHDLNQNPELPLDDGAFDAVVCTVSVEYLIHPIEVFREVARVLKPGALFVVTFSDRWFPPKVIRLWTELHPFERLGLVIEYFRRAGRFANIHTESIRGYTRPADDKYARLTPHSDPVFAVWGHAAGKT